MKEIHYSPKKESVIGKHSHIVGKLRFAHGMRIQGQFDGEIVAGGDLIIEESSQVKANINLKNLQLDGKLTGNAIVDQSVHISQEAQLEGDILTRAISIAQGAKLKGKIHMMSSNEVVDIFSAKPEQLKKSLLKQ
ncbi:bactofilin family protein [Entomospira culicis]|uniref:Polymer-forming cytoskeletal protein n=1 Tax=Entomospira culicis TaxID=2719989 RepID=A0A968GH13_9SPIO|nr:polymer-forming cytoskeletal protein [Entomospira culicis]NIZ19419.1 polymer-forming cytoskeletal protein [Entomospira culicis]NIZ69676.1 polymer-forming cytoskeletal protein [Entomospira culicis]WDI36786.1 polymer-forming cytoskeletal protein [Entomospira culicis]WDI38415.1 polymer-forming cytoskeletal protein [Entomospira culicis]